MTDSNDRQDRYEVVARLGAVERRLATVELKWREFRKSPTPRRLVAMRRAVASTNRALARLEQSLNRPTAHSRADSSRAAHTPSPRALVAAGRELDSLIHEVTRAWRGNRKGLGTDSLAAISGMLERAERAATTLARALRSLDGPDRGLEPEVAPDPSEARSTLQELLDRIADEWNGLRREPTLAGTIELHETLLRARLESESLIAIADSTSVLSTPEALRYLGGAADSVHFPPYRDRHTGTYNGRGFEVSAVAELARCSRYGKPFGLILMKVQDSDDGHAREIIGSIRGLLRSTDLLGRTAGGVLVLALPESDGRITRRIAARILRALEAADHSRAVHRLAYAVSPEDGDSLTALFDVSRKRLISVDRRPAPGKE